MSTKSESTKSTIRNTDVQQIRMILAKDVVRHLHHLDKMEQLWLCDNEASTRPVYLDHLRITSAAGLSLNVVNARDTTVLLWRECLQTKLDLIAKAQEDCEQNREENYAFHVFFCLASAYFLHHLAFPQITQLSQAQPLHHRTVEGDTEWIRCGSEGHHWRPCHPPQRKDHSWRLQQSQYHGRIQ